MSNMDWAITCDCGKMVVHERNDSEVECSNCGKTYDEQRNIIEKEDNSIEVDDWAVEAQFFTHVQFAL